MTELYTMTDAIDDLDDFARAHGSAPTAVLRRCVRAAYKEIMLARDWSFLYANGRIQLQAVQTTGTIAYDHTGGTYERQLTLTDATWPEDVADWVVRIDDVVSEVDRRISDTVITLDATLNPGADVDAETSYRAYPLWYLLPTDFGRMLVAMEKASWVIGEYVPFAEMAQLDAYRDTDGDVRQWSVGSPRGKYGRLALYVHPASDTTEPFSFAYRKKARELRYTGYNSAEYAGTIAVTAGSPTVTGTSTEFTSGMVGSLLRISATAARPTGLEGTNPWIEQHVIQSVTNTLALTLEDTVTTGRTGRGYVISDPIDFEGAAWEAFLRCCEKHLALAQNSKSLPAVVRMAADALLLAKEGDARVGGRRICGPPRVHVTRLREATDRPILS